MRKMSTKEVESKLRKAGLQNKRCKMIYSKTLGKETTRIIAPYAIEATTKKLHYLIASDTRTGAKKLKTFILERIQSVTILTQGFNAIQEVTL